VLSNGPIPGVGQPVAEYEWANYRDVRVAFTKDLDGGGTSFGQALIPFVANNVGKVGRVFEWCSGPGFIGLSLLAHGLCDSLCLADKNPAAVEAAITSVRVNGLEDVVSVYESDCLDGIPTHESWDLVVGNPPHAQEEVVREIPWPSLIYADHEWSIHRRFYDRVAAFLRPAASVLVIENGLYSTPADFRPMIENAGLDWVGSFPAGASFYFVCSRAAT
jgi:methylase of polypeptide subunit release factors